MKTKPDRQVKRRGNRLGIGFFKVALRLTGLRGAYGLLYIVCVHYLLFDRLAVRAAQAYIDRRFPDRSPFARRVAVYRLFVEQGKNLIDRHALIAGAQTFDIQVRGSEKIPPETAGGFILLTSHLGNWQIVMQALRKMNRTVHLLMRPEDNAALRETMQFGAESERLKVISREGHLGGVVAIMQALEKGDVVSIMGDRTYQADGVAVDFFGAPAFFPYSAFQIAASAGCPLVILLAAKTAKNRYAVEFSDVLKPAWRQPHGKRQQMRAWVQQYARILETYLRRHPLQYFIFHDLWEEARRRGEPERDSSIRRVS